MLLLKYFLKLSIRLLPLKPLFALTANYIVYVVISIRLYHIGKYMEIIFQSVRPAGISQ